MNPDDPESVLLARMAQSTGWSSHSLRKEFGPTAETCVRDQRSTRRIPRQPSLGELALARGNSAVGLDDEEKAKQIAIEQTAVNPDDREWQRDLAVAYREKIADVQVVQGKPDALKFYNDDIAIIRRLAKTDPMDARGQRDLSICYDKIGDVEEK